MTQAVNSTRRGNAFQARIFWCYAAKLLDATTAVQRVGFESGPRGFDDVWVEYADGKGPSDQFGNRLRVERFQCKWHAANGSFTHVDLTDPQYTGAPTFSLLERARDAYRADQSLGQRSRIRLMTNHRLDAADALYGLVKTQDHTLKLNEFFDGTTKRSKLWQVRDLWKRHLQIDEAELRGFAPTLALCSVSESMEDIRMRMDDTFRAFGIKPTDVGASSTIYDDLPYAWLGQGRNEWDAKSFRDACAQDNLLAAHAPTAPIKVFGVKSFEHSFDRLEARCDQVLDLLPAFDTRYIRPEVSWDNDVLPRLTDFVRDAARSEQRLRLAMDAHLSLSFAAGTVLDTKSGRVVELEQRLRNGSAIWAPDDAAVDPNWPDWQFTGEDLQIGGTDIAVAISVTRPTEADVRSYVQGKGEFGRLVVASLSSGATQASVLNGAHADWLADKLANHLKSLRIKVSTQVAPRIHLFMAAPGSFAFFLGRHIKALQPATVYEYDYGGDRDGTYEPSLSIPKTT